MGVARMGYIAIKVSRTVGALTLATIPDPYPTPSVPLILP